MLNKALERASVCLGACLFLGPLRDVKMPCKQVSLSIGAPLGNVEGVHLPGLFERKG